MSIRRSWPILIVLIGGEDFTFDLFTVGTGTEPGLDGVGTKLCRRDFNRENGYGLKSPLEWRF